MKLPPEQQAIRNKCFHPSGMFVEFAEDAMEHSIPESFEKIVRTNPDRVAVKTTNLLLTYTELNRAANQAGRAILAQCGDEKEPVAVCLGHGADVIIAVLACWKAGKIFVPLDPSLPHSRNKAILDSTQTRLVVSDASHRDYIGQIQTDLRLINIDEPAATGAAENIGGSIAPDDLAYILFTSGSTGKPKGVMQNHRNVLNQIKRETNGLHICADDRLILVRSCSAIGGIRIVLSALLNGAAVYPFDVAQVGPGELAEVLAREEITIYDSTPTTFRHFIPVLAKKQQYSHLRLIRLSSEPVHKQDVDLYKKHFLRNCIFANSLGLTETAGTIRHNLIDHDTKVTSDTVPVGYAVEEMEVVLLDDDGHEVGAEKIGEIAVRSRYLSPGYWGNPELTKAKFIVGPDDGDGRLYLTGDLGQMLDDGSLVHLGRKDFQVKVRGYKIDVAEIERALLALESIEAVVVVARADRDEDLSLIAYLVSATTPAPTNSALRHALSDKLPEYMIPSSFVLLEALPTTPTGKVDRGRLPLTDRTRPPLDAVFVQPRSDRERSLTRIWQDVLHIDEIGIDDNFFDLGGNSLRLAEVNLKMRTAFKMDIPLVDMFALPTVRTLAEYFVRPGDKLAKLDKSHDRAKIRRALKERRKR